MSDRFKKRTHFPGTEGGPFDLVVRAWDWIELVPWPFFLAGLLILARLISPGIVPGAVLGGFFILDYLLLLWLPRTGISFGPPKAPTLMLALMRMPFSLLPFEVNVVFQGLGSALVVYAFYIEPQGLQISHQKLDAGGFNPARPLRILHFGDLHFEHRTPREAKLLAAADHLRPDLILFSGDFLNYSYTYDRSVWVEAKDILCEFSAPLGVFCVRGSPPVDPPNVLDAILPDHFTCLRNEIRQLSFLDERFDVIGVDCSHNPDHDAEVLRAALAGSNAPLKILLYHSPDLAPDASGHGITLQLSGHTHGGQVRLPLFGALYAASLYGKRFESGRYQLGDMILYVTRGVGLEGKGAPRVRFFCPPEITLWEIS